MLLIVEKEKVFLSSNTGTSDTKKAINIIVYKILERSRAYKPMILDLEQGLT